MSRLLTRLAAWWLRRSAGPEPAVAITLDSEPPPAPEPAYGRGDRHVVTRRLKDRTWTLYDGPHGARARRWVEHVKREREPGRMWYVMHDANGAHPRGEYEHPDPAQR